MECLLPSGSHRWKLLSNCRPIPFSDYPRISPTLVPSFLFEGSREFPWCAYCSPRNDYPDVCPARENNHLLFVGAANFTRNVSDLPGFFTGFRNGLWTINVGGFGLNFRDSFQSKFAKWLNLKPYFRWFEGLRVGVFFKSWIGVW